MGGRYGMRPFVPTEDFRALNVGFAMDEGLASPDEQLSLFYAERAVWRKFKLNFKFKSLAIYILTISNRCIFQHQWDCWSWIAFAAQYCW